MSFYQQKEIMKFHIAVIIIALLGAIGWIANVVKLVGMGFTDISGMLIARSIGVVLAPLGAVLGYL